MSDSHLTVAVCQFAPDADRAANRERVAALTADAAARGATLVVFPEYSSYFVDPMDDTLAANAETLDGPFATVLRRLAAQHGVTVVAGLVEAGEGSRVGNTVIAADAGGIRAVYRKQHLYDAFGQTESDWIEPGALDADAVFQAGGLTVGLMTCYDLRFPEVARTLIDRGADVLVVPAEWVRGPLKEHHWQTLLTARAIENTAYVVSADHPGPIGVGLSQVIDPQGVVLAGVGSGEGVAVAALAPAVIARVRDTNPALRLRRYRVVPA
ncbi:carbon-nitrogen hydrolase family protein [Microbacterium neungamense]|uniref:carbon-nitrogen hydrolase family protein n=1 Tax=Microbacterium neungamense TaxID=2810535 RepID=UPI00217EA0E2|nr:carbon-nitrogen hydrolase family protein [Microbacterium neungamense]UWF78158.1 carbon-nitrogen hydrolase family protein [Microbacterium neungamense]